MNVILNSQQEKFIVSQIQTGKYQTVEQVIGEALSLLERHDRQSEQTRLEELRQKIAVGTEQIQQGKITDGEIVFSRLQKRLNKEYGLEK
jgi:antitoxin ParD1/3/4